ncbi:hypothetical protein EDC01DRAFT_260189 [Geopyxis carbonaria]|nr:hypothetical protein EDC01DRAFT_260189 [Geopyxis carbonaria]
MNPLLYSGILATAAVLAYVYFQPAMPAFPVFTVVWFLLRGNSVLHSTDEWFVPQRLWAVGYISIDGSSLRQHGCGCLGNHPKRRRALMSAGSLSGQLKSRIERQENDSIVGTGRWKRRFLWRFGHGCRDVRSDFGFSSTIF